jgi:hypothetical protein
MFDNPSDRKFRLAVVQSYEREEKDRNIPEDSAPGTKGNPIWKSALRNGNSDIVL